MGRCIRGTALGADFSAAASQSVGARVSWNFCPRVKFTPELWEVWRRQRETDAQSLHLRDGILQFRKALEARYVPDIIPRAAGTR